MQADWYITGCFSCGAKVIYIELVEVLKFELEPIPWSLASVDGTLVKIAQSSLLAVLESKFPSDEAVPADAAFTVETMIP